MLDKQTPFTNPVLDADHLPDYSDAELQPVAPKFGRYVLYSTLSYWLPFIVISLIAGLLPFISSSFDHLLAVPLALIALSIYWYRLADARHRGWALREHDLIAKSGVWWRSVTTLPVARIQHVETSSGPLERKLNLARLSCYTAGGMTADLVVIALEADTADRLREHLLEQIRRRDAQEKNAAHASADDVVAEVLETIEKDQELDFLDEFETDAAQEDRTKSESPARD